MKAYVDRTVAELVNGSPRLQETKSLKDYEDREAFVLLGPPGAGKTTEFKKESERWEDAICVAARDFTRLDVQEEWKGKALFIDGLDEMRANHADDPLPPLDKVRARLQELGMPRFRLSCREVDWLGRSDQSALERVLLPQDLVLLRLNPLTYPEISEIAKQRNAPDFVAEAYNRGLWTLLENPLTLDLLLSARENDGWPDTITATFQQGCVQLSKEFNLEHQAGNPSKLSTDDLLHESGHLCAVILLVGLDGIRSQGNSSEKDIAPISELSGIRQGVAREAIRTLLFEVENDTAKPRHRQIAEYLAARYLSTRIEQGLSPRRLLAVLTDNDSRVAAPFRGLAAWLAVFCRELRLLLIEQDPIAVVSYGDVNEFSVGEKQKLLSSLELLAEYNPWLVAGAADGSRWGGLATSDMQEILQKYLLDAESSETRMMLLYPLLDALRHGEASSALMPLMIGILRSESHPLEIKKKAFEVRKKHLDSPGSDADLKQLLNDLIENPKLPHREGLVDLLLKVLYPRLIPASELPGYFIYWHTSQRSILQSDFWTKHVLQHSTNEELTDILNAFVEYGKKNNATPRAENSYLSLVIEVFAKTLIELKRRVGFPNPALVFAWLEFAVRPLSLQENRNLAKFMRELCRDESACKEYVERRVAKHLGTTLPAPQWLIPQEHLPEDFATWCINKAIAAARRDEQKFYLQYAYRISADDSDGKNGSAIGIRERLQAHPRLLVQWNSIEENASKELSDRDELQRWVAEEQAETARTHVEEFERHQAALKEGTASARYLDVLANVYFGELCGAQGATPKERLLDYFGHQHELVELALAALRKTPRREDLPRESEILSLAGTDERYLITYPYLAGLELSLSDHDPAPDWFSDVEIRRALAFQLSVLPLHGQDKRPAWYRNLLTTQPNVVTVAFEQVVKRFLRSKAVDFPQLYDLFDDDHEQVASLLILPLLRSFPTRFPKTKLHSLLKLIQLAFRLWDQATLSRLVNSKLALKSLMPSQRVYWVCTGLVLEPNAYLDQLRNLFEGRGNQRLLRYVSEFLFEFEPLKKGNARGLLEPQAIELLIRLLGPGYRENWHKIRTLDPLPQVHGSVVVNGLINALATNPDPESGNYLISLAEADSLRHLRKRFRFDAENHRRSFPASSFEHPRLEQVLEFLQDRGPANVADLAALAVDLIDELADRIRNGENSDWRQYWDGISDRSEEKERRPLVENACRDRFLSDLQLMLPGGVRADGEARHLGDKHSDIRVSCGQLEIPLEFKKSHSNDLWLGIHNQLIPRYTKSPGAKGHGMYVVFWFGKDYRKASPKGIKPESAKELQCELEATLPSAQAHKILVRVIDVCGPFP